MQQEPLILEKMLTEYIPLLGFHQIHLIRFVYLLHGSLAALTQLEDMESVEVHKMFVVMYKLSVGEVHLYDQSQVLERVS